jgi:hypothetical protein
MTPSGTLTAIFSFNRGQLLDNCVRSVEKFSPDTPIAVFDDASDDPETLRVLREVADRDHE